MEATEHPATIIRRDQIRTLWESLGFSEISTGGGCEAYSIERGDERILVTDGDAGLPTAGSSVYIGFYDADDQCVVYFDCADSIQAVAIFRQSDWYKA